MRPGGEVSVRSQMRLSQQRVWSASLVVSLVLGVWLLIPEAGEACAVCYGAADSPLTTGMNYGILTLLGVVAVVQGGFIALFVAFWQRGRRQRRRRDRFHLIQGGTG